MDEWEAFDAVATVDGEAPFQNYYGMHDIDSYHVTEWGVQLIEKREMVKE